MAEHTAAASVAIIVPTGIPPQKGSKMSISSPLDGIERELERERHERALHDDERTGLGLCDELRTKDAREHVGAVNLRRPPAH